MMPAWILSFCSGFLSLSFEVLWVRLFAFAEHSMPQAFAFVLAFYLIGISFGAWIGKYCCEKSANLWRVSGISLFLACLVTALGPWFYVMTLNTVHEFGFAALAIFLTAGLISVVFPIAHHLGTETTGPAVGRSLSRVYVANIMGATIGPLFSGIILLALVTTQQAFLICVGLMGLLALCCLLQSWPRRFACLVWSLMMLGFLSDGWDAHALIAKAATPFAPIRKIVENQYGIVVSYAFAKGGDAIYGGNVYDGRTNVDPIVNSNGIHRILILPALQTEPKRVLIIGLSVGTWLALVNTFPQVEHIDVIEINPGYLQLIEDYPIQQHALQDPRVHLNFDDGRRWLKAHPDNKYDLVIMNTTFHWRAYSANLLSREFISMLKHHMNPGAVMTYNTTSSLDALKTASVVFSSAYLYGNFVVAADFDWRAKLRDPKAEDILAGLQLEGKPLFPKDRRDVIKKFLRAPVYSANQMQHAPSSHRPLEVVTDRNLITEYKYGRPLE